MPLDAEKNLPSLGQLALFLALLCVISAPLLVGAVHAEVVAGLAALAHVALALHVVDRWRAGRSLHLSWLGLPIAAGLAFTWLQLLPLPKALRALLSPEGTRRVEYITEPLPSEYLELVRPVLSLDPPESALAALRISLALCVFVVVADRCRRRENLRLAYRTLLVGTVALVLVLVAHEVLALDKIYGAYKPGTKTPLLLPLINPNHAARAFGALGLVCLARAVALRPRSEWLWFLGGALASLGAMLSAQSYGAVLSLVVGCTLLLMLRARAATLHRTGAAAERLSPRLLVGIALGALAGLSAFVVIIVKALNLGAAEGTPLFQRSKLALYEPALNAFTPFWRLGAGNNAFQPAFSSSIEPGAFWNDVTVTHPESVLLQVLFDHGVVLGVALCLLVLFVSLRIAQAGWEGRSLTALPALVFLVFGDLTDFSLEVGFGALLGACLLGLVSAEGDGPWTLKLDARRVAPAAAVLTLLACAAALMAVPDARFSTDRALRDQATPNRRDLARHALARHPSDAYYAYVLATSARAEKQPRETLKWITRSLYLQPSFIEAHIEAARVLFALGYVDQGLLEYELALVAGSKHQVPRDLARRPVPYEKLRTVVENHPQARSELCGFLGRRQRHEDHQACLDDAAAHGDGRAAAMSIRSSLKRGDTEGARRRLDELMASAPFDDQVAVSLAEVTAAERSLDAALDESAEWLRKLKDAARLLEWRVEAAIKLKRYVDARQALELLRRQPGRQRDDVWLDMQSANVAKASGELAEALTYHRRVLRRRPNDVGVLVQAADTCLRLGLASEARIFIDRAQALKGGTKAVDGLNQRLDEAAEDARRERLRRLMRTPADDAAP